MANKLIISNSDSFQAISDNKIKCPICFNNVESNKTFMTTCKHSWCFECNDNLTKNQINNCPICKSQK